MFNGDLPCFPLAAAQGLFLSHESSQSTKRLNDNDRKQEIQKINKEVHQTVSKY